LGEEIKYIPVEIPRGIDLFGSIRAIKKLKEIFKKEKFDFIQYSTPNAGLYASIAGKSVGITIRNYHLMGIRYLGEKGIKKKILKCLEKLACKNSTHIECVSKSNLEFAIKEKLFDRKKAVVVHNGSSGGLDLKRFNSQKREEFRNEIRVKYGIKEEEFVFGFVGRITRDKGVNEILSAFEKINNAKLMMVGPKENIEGLDEKLYKQSLHNEQILYTGAVSDVEKYYCAMDVLLFPSYREGFGNVVMEAGAMGTPSIISNIPGPIDQVVEGQTALIVKPHNSGELFDAMVKIMDDKLLEYLSKNCVGYIREKFNEDQLNDCILERKINLMEAKNGESCNNQ
jgi:glycosyltransferase involved in cell wall biosynthesis